MTSVSVLLFTSLLACFSPTEAAQTASALQRAIAANNPAEVERLLVADPRLAHAPIMDAPPIFAAISGKKREIFELLLAHGADINAVSKRGQTALSLTTLDDSDEWRRRLLQAGANVNAESSTGKRALHWAVEEQNLHAVRWLVKHGAVDGPMGPDSRTAINIAEERLDYAAYASKKEIATEILRLVRNAQRAK